MGVRAENSTNYVHADEPNLLNVHKAMDYNTIGQPVLRTSGGNMQYLIDVGLGNISGYTNTFRHGFNPSVANNSEETLWTGSTLYPWSSWTSAVTIDFVSSSVSDTMQIYIEGLDTNYAPQTELLTLNGTGTVTTKIGRAHV